MDPERMRLGRILSSIFALIGAVASVIGAIFIIGYFDALDAFFAAGDPNAFFAGHAYLPGAMIFLFVANVGVVFAIYIYASGLSVHIQDIEEKLAKAKIR